MQSRDEQQTHDPHLWYRRMRVSEPVYYHPEDRLWMVFRYAEAEYVLNHTNLFSSGGSLLYSGKPKPISDDPISNSLLSMDPPRHRQLRSLVTQAFTPKAATQLSDQITSIIIRLLDTVGVTGTMDVYEHLAAPLPALVMAELLGIPHEDRTLFITWSEIISHGGMAPAAMRAYFLRVINERSNAPRDDVISTLLTAQVDGQQLTHQELLGFCVLLLAAGIQPTRNLIAAIFFSFFEHQDLLEELHREPHLIPGAIEEVLRYSSPFQYVQRIATTDTMLGGRRIQARQRLLVHLASANRDEAQFPDPDHFDIRRTPNRHLTFGHGIHFCLGAPLARLETKIMLTLLQERFQDIRPLPRVIGTPPAQNVMHPSMPITFRQRRGENH